MKENRADGQIVVGLMGCVLIPKVQSVDSHSVSCVTGQLWVARDFPPAGSGGLVQFHPMNLYLKEVVLGMMVYGSNVLWMVTGAEFILGPFS